MNISRILILTILISKRMKPGIILLLFLFLVSCTARTRKLPLHKTKYGFIQKDKYVLSDSIRLPNFSGTLYLYRFPNHLMYCDVELIKIDSTGEEILIPANDALSMPPGSNIEYFNYDFTYQDLERFLNENRDRLLI